MTPQPPSLDEMHFAAKGLEGVVVHSPLVEYRGGAADVWVKAETVQAIGSFKLRGIFHAASQLSEEQRAHGLSTVSAGNTAQAVAWVGRHFGVPARSLMPATAPITKIEAVKALGGEPVLVPRDEVFRYMREHAWEQEPYAFIHPWTNRDVMTGHASLGLEIVADRPDVETVFIPVGGGGLLAGVGSAIKTLRPDVRLVAVEPEGCPSFHAALAARGPVDVDCSTICDGVAVPYTTAEMFPLLRDLADDSVLVSEFDVRAAIKRLATANALVAEGAGALALAAATAMSNKERGVSVCILSGGSIDAPLLAEIISDPKI
ncbi:MAG: pyridoxal-phosphate dependent enzyme [Acidimicrobiales bacterium]